MDHKTCRDNLSAFLDGELPPGERALVEAHLAGCPECAGVLAGLGKVSGIFKKHAMEPVPPSLKEGVFGSRGAEKAYNPWLKPVLALSAAAAGVLIFLNVPKSPQRAPLQMKNGYSPAELSMNAASAPRAEAVGSGSSFGMESADKAPAPRTAARTLGYFGQAKAAAIRGAISGSSISAMTSAKAAKSYSAQAAGGSSLDMFAAKAEKSGYSSTGAGMKGISPETDYVASNYTRDGQAVNRFANSPKLYRDKTAAGSGTLKPYLDALRAAGAAGGAAKIDITGAFESDKYGAFVFYSAQTGPGSNTSGFMIMAGKSIKFKDEQTWPGPYAKQLWDIFEHDGEAWLLVDVTRNGTHFFEHYRLSPGNTEFSGTSETQ